jgi:hypothetical protein
MSFSLCGTTASNTGPILCDTERGVPSIILAGGASFAPSDYATNVGFQAALIAKLKKANSASDKLFPFPVVQDVADATTAAKTGTLGLGLVRQLTRSKAGYTFGVIAGTSLEKRLIKFNNKILPLFIFDDNSNFWGLRDSQGNFLGTPYLVTIDPAGFQDGNNVKTTKVNISVINSKDFTENASFASTSFTTNDLTGLIDVYPFETGAHTANAYHIGLKVLSDEIKSYINVHDNTGYPAALASPSMWVAKVGANFATTLAITSVTDEPSLNGWALTFDSTAYAALATSAKIQVGLVTPDLLDAAGATGIEGATLILTK